MAPLDDWLDVTDLPFNSLLLLERVQLSWFPGWVPEHELGTALRANPAVEWYLRQVPGNRRVARRRDVRCIDES